MITVRSTINLSSQTVPQIIPVVQGDTGRSILFTLADFTIPQGSTATYYVQKPSGEAVYNTATVDGNTVLVELTAQSIIEAGDNYGQVRIENDGEVVTSFDFILLVKPFRGIDATQSTTEMNIFDKAVEQAEEAIDEAKTGALDDIGDAKDAALQEIEQSSGNFADAFSTSTTYAAGDYVIYSGQLYRFTANHATGAWSGSDAEAVTVGEELTDLNVETTSLKEEYTQILDSAYVTDTASGSIASFPDGADGVPVKSLTVNIEPVQSGSGDPSPDNVRPISGHTQAVVTRTGKNLADYDNENNPNRSTFNYSSDTAESLIATKVNSGGAFFVQFRAYIIEGETYTFSFGKCTLDGTAMSMVNVYIYSDRLWGTAIKGNWNVGGTGSEWVSTYTGEAIVGIFNNSSAGTEIELEKFQIELGSTATAYEPYQGQTVTIDLDGTRYGGTLDVTTGVLTVDKGFHTFNGTEAWEDYSSFNGFVTRATNSLMKAGVRQDGMSNMLKVSKDSTAGQTNVMWLGINSSLFFAIGVYESMGNTVDAFKTYLSEHNLELVYPLANPFTVQLTANDIMTLLGQNNIWSDAGDVDVEYRADTKLYIEKLTAPTEDDMIADHAISANSFFMVGNTLYRATTAIASGATITVGTNATKLSLSEALNALS